MYKIFKYIFYFYVTKDDCFGEQGYEKKALPPKD